MPRRIAACLVAMLAINGTNLAGLGLVVSANAFASFSPNSTDTYHYPAHARGLEQEKPFVDARRVESGSIELDGRLDDRAWNDVPAGWGFVEHEPDRGEAASVETVFKVAYDDEAVYFGVACFEDDTSLTSSALSRRDQLQNSDMVSIYIDPYHDFTTGYNFRVNPDGVQADHYIFNDGNRDPDWNAVWQAETSHDARGWYTEMRIPFSAIRYRPSDKMTWGLQVYRWLHGRGEDTGWANWDRNESGFVSRWGELRNLSGVPAPKQLEIVPYTVGRLTDPNTPGRGDTWDQFGNFGADLKYGLTADLTLNATIQPDFGQVEADPSVLNLGPFETQFEEKRPFFIEGAQSFQHRDFNMFYSRRIGAGGENTRIRFASKLTGKTAGDISVAGLFATTDQTITGRAHNPFETGSNLTHYAVGRVGKEFDEGKHRINFMQTAVLRDSSLRQTIDDNTYLSRDGYSSGADFEMTFAERSYRLAGSVVGTFVDDAPVANDATVDHDTKVGTGGSLQFNKTSGVWRSGTGARWESDKLDPNDVGILFAPDEYSSYFWLQRRLDPKDDAYFVNGSLNLNLHRSWLFASRDLKSAVDPSESVFNYGSGKPQNGGGNINGWIENRHRWSSYFGVNLNTESRSKYATRWYEGELGPLAKSPTSYGGWYGFDTDWRKTLIAGIHTEMYWDAMGSDSQSSRFALRWIQSSRLNHRVTVGYSQQRDKAQWVGNHLAAAGQPDLGGVSYIFGELENKTLDITWRSNVLFTRDQSLEIYVQPFLATGNYTNPRALLRADTRDLGAVDEVQVWDEATGAYVTQNYDVTQSDFELGSVNANVVYRWEYRPGSTVFLVWTHQRGDYRTRAGATDPSQFNTSFDRQALFGNEPINTFLVKVTYWFSL